MNQNQIMRNRLTNLLHTILLFAGMIGLLALLGLSLAGVNGLVWASLLGGLFLLFSQHASPYLMLRLVKARPLAVQEAPGLYQLIETLAHRADLPRMPRLYYIPDRMMNAFAVGSRDEAAIGLTEGLLRHLDKRELAGVLAHEISHIRHNDMRVMSVAALISRLTSLFSSFGQLLLFLNLPLLLFGRTAVSWFAILLLLVAPLLSSLLQLALSRTREFEADLGAAHLTGDPEGLVTALQKMASYQDNPFKRILRPGYSTSDPSLFRTHPRTDERVNRLRQLVVSNEPWLIQPA
jgi:heat shock protein HtpX